MTPRTLSNSPSVTSTSVDHYTEPQASPEEDSGDELRPTHTSEIGTLKKLPNHNTAWLGSSSGVYFVNTVRRAFSAAFCVNNKDTAVPPSEDILTGDDVDGQSYNGPIREASKSEGEIYRKITTALGRPPSDRKIAMELVTTFFRLWHPLFPFLHGPQFLKDIDDIYSWGDVGGAVGVKSAKGASHFATPSEHRKLVTFQLIINIASLDRSDIDLPKESKIKSTWDATQMAGYIAIRHDIETIQACLAAELYLVATICLRQASTVAGIILKLIYHAGLHRCPLRYAQLSLEDCEIRKRIFWSAYALDRYLSLSLGDPNTVQDSDIDVCLSGKELHKAVARELIIDPSDEMKMHLPHDAASSVTGDRSSPEDPRVSSMNNGPQALEKQLREAAMTAYVHYGKLTGQVIEIFHKSIHARFPKQDAILYLKTDMENWWNGLPSSLTGEDDNGQDESVAPHHRQLAPYFMLLYQQLLLVLNRPRLSLDQSTAEFQHGLQVCIKASRTSIIALKKHKEQGQSMLLPGLLSATWMAGLITAFACQLGKYPKARACSDISACLRILESIGSKNWFTVKNCHKVLSLLSENINARKASAAGFLVASSNPSHVSAPTLPLDTQVLNHSRKRSHPPDDESVSGPSPKREGSLAGSIQSPSKPDFRMPLHPASSSMPRPEPQRSSFLPSTQLDKTMPLSSGSLAAIGYNGATNPSTATISPAKLSTASFDSSFPYTGSDSTGLPAISTSVGRSTAMSEDPMFWGNFDMTMQDIFSAVSWENMTGFGGPMPMSMTGNLDDGMEGGSTNMAGFEGNGGGAGFIEGSVAGLEYNMGTGIGAGMGGNGVWNGFGFGQLGNNKTSQGVGSGGKQGGQNQKLDQQGLQ